MGINADFLALLNNQEFILVYVPSRFFRPREKMRLVCPARDPKIQSALRYGQKYYALSHLWGIPSDEQEQHMWHEIGDYINGEDGNPVPPVPMRAEKRSTLLKLLQAHRGYWWIDVLCARVSTPLVVMGDIYKQCRRCYAMIDCLPSVQEAINPRVKEMRNDHPKDLLLLFQNSPPKDMKEHIIKLVEKWSEVLQLVQKLVECRWWNRVWTWQEASLPSTMLLLSEISGDISDDHLLEWNDLDFLSQWALTIRDEPSAFMRFGEGVAQTLLETMTFFSQNLGDKLGLPQSVVAFVSSMEALGKSTRTCLDPVDYVYGVIGMLDLDVPRLDCHQAVWRCFLGKLKELIEHLFDTHDDERRFGQEAIPVSISISEKANHVDLSKARNMADVYDGLLVVMYRDEYSLERTWLDHLYN